MNRFALVFGLTALFVVPAMPSCAQDAAGEQRPSPPPATGTPRPSSPGRSATGGMDQMQGPMYVSGRIALESGRPAPESVSVELNCGMRPLQVIHTDLGGYFTFSLGSGFQSNMDFSASNETPMSAGAGRMTPMGGIGGIGRSLTGCELRVSVPGYHPLTYTLSQHSDMGRYEVGTLHLRRIAGVEGSAISLTSLMVPSRARKEYEKGAKEARNNRPEAAKQHFEKAVAQYDQYAAAWSGLGKIYSANKDNDKAREAYQKAIAADPQYTPPYLSLATLELQAQQWDKAVETAGKLLQLDSSVAFASFIQAVGNYNLNRLDEAEKSAHEAEKAHDKIPQVHALLAQIYLDKQDYSRAASQMRTYLQESPQGPFADQMKKNLEEIQNAQAEAENNNTDTAPEIGDQPTPAGEPQPEQ